MPRGSKICPKCQNRCGVRSFNCAKCGAGFEVQGIVYPDKNNAEKVVEDECSAPDSLMRHIVEIKYDKCDGYGEELRAWESLCKKYHIRYYTNRFGVSLGETKNYRVVLNNGYFEPVGEARSLSRAIQIMIKHRRQA